MNPYIQEANQQFVSVYNRYPIVLDHGDGMYLYDTEGKKYLDFGSGIGVCGLGYHDPQYIEALQKEGILVIPSGTNVIRLLPPLILEEEHVNILIQALSSLF